MTETAFGEREDIVSTLELSISNGMLGDIAPDDPYIDALVWLLLLVDAPLDQRRLLQSFPHLPEAFGLSDLRNVLSRIGLSSRVVKATESTIASIRSPGLLIHKNGTPYVITGEDDVRSRHPTTGEPGPRSAFEYRWLLHIDDFTSTRSVSRNAEWRGEFRAKLQTLFFVKALLAAISVVTALGIVAIYQAVIPAGSGDTLIALGLGLAGALALDFSLRRIKASLISEMSERAEYALSTAIFGQIISLPFERILSGTPGQQVARMRQLMSSANSSSVHILDAALELPSALVLLFVVAILAPALALVLLALLLALVLLALFTAPGLKRLEKRARTARSDYTRDLQYLVTGRSQILADGTETLWADQLQKKSRISARSALKLEGRQRILDAVVSSAGPLSGGVMTIAGAYLAMTDALTAGALLGSIILGWRIVGPFQTGYQTLLRGLEMREQKSSIETLFSMDREVDGTDFPLNDLDMREIVLDGIMYRYPGASESALRGVSLKIPKGALVAITGPSGSGKTTLLRTIVSLVSIKSGRVLLGGVNTRQLPASSLRSAVSYVSANTKLMHGSIAQNLRLGNPLATDAELWEICRLLGLEEAILQLPEALETRLTAQQRETLPSGFAQSIAIGQALLENPQVILLDEPASGMDPGLECAFLDALIRLRGNKTVLMVTHRPSHVRLCDAEVKLLKGQLKRSARPSEVAHA